MLNKTLLGFAVSAALLFGSCASTTPPAPAVQRVDLQTGQLQTLSAGKPLALIFWQSWCAPCVREAPKVQAAFEQFGGQIQIIGVVSGPDDAVDRNKLDARIADLGLTYDQVRDRDITLAEQFGVTGTPTIVIIDLDGNVVFNEHRVPSDWTVFLGS